MKSSQTLPGRMGLIRASRVLERPLFRQCDEGMMGFERPRPL